MKEFKGVQKEILLADKKNQLVSAGAGSGKTTVMIEKISTLLLEKNVDVDNLLVVTFTVLAAQEMKERLIKKLKETILTSSAEEKERILSIIEKINTASIDTIDGFASKTIKKYFYDLAISPNIEIVSDATKDYYLTRAMKKTFDEYSKAGEEINLLLDLFGGNSRNLNSLQDLILASYYNVVNIEDYEGFLNSCISEYQDSIKSENVLNNYMCNIAQSVASQIVEEYVTFTSGVQEKLSFFVERLQKFNKYVSFKSNLQILNELEQVRFAPSEYKQNEGLKNLNSKIADIFEFKNNLEKNQINENYEENNKEIIKYFKIFIKLLKNFIKNYNNIKENNNLIDFNDLNRLMLKLLENKNIQKELQEKYTYIFIDEYQDVNPLQDSLMSKLVGEKTTLFMVGDVKQSIYGFRGSSPEWFLKKYNNMKKDSGNEDVFDMNINFRSSPTILNFINLIFSKLMTQEIADINYVKDCLIEPKRDDIVDDKVKILLVEDDKDVEFDQGVYSVKQHEQRQTLNSKDKEALLVLKTITELVGTDFYDANLKQHRKLKYSDIAILTHSDKDESSTTLIDVLKQHSVPLNKNNKLEIDSSETIKLIISILKCVINTADDVDYLATFMALTDLTIDDVTEIRDKNFTFYENLLNVCENDEINAKILSGFKILEDIKNSSYSMTNSELISYILNKKKLKYFILRKENGERELGLLKEFILKLSPIEDSLGLTEFVEIVESNVDSSGDFVSVDKEDSVTIQTIHKSKGLEYPVVILFNSSKVFAHLRENDSIIFNSSIGFGVDYFDTVNRIKKDSLTKYAIKLANNQKGYKEELRLLYVALTRAKNKLIITGVCSKKDFSDLKKTSYTNMLLSCFADQIVDDRLEKDTFILEFVKDFDICNDIKVNDERQIVTLGKDFKYKHEDKFLIPLKNTVTGINSELSQTDGYRIKNVMSANSQYDIENKAQIGVEYHAALEAVDFTKPYEQTTNFANVDYKKIEKAHTVLLNLANGAIDIKKEAQFMMFVPYKDVVKSDIEDKILIQGVVDLIIEKEETITIVDYKFSKLPALTLKEKYKEQLNLYKMAVENAYKKPVEHMFIYSINTSELV